MLHYWSLDSIQLNNAWLTIGSFDGVHRGHQEVVRNLTAEAHTNGAPAVVLTFYPHPAVVLKKRPEAFYLTTPEERATLLGFYGVDYVITHPFNVEVAKESAQEFIARLHAHLGLSRLLVGRDFALGRGREGNVDRLKEIGQAMGYTVEPITPFELEGSPVSSSRVRAALARGDVRLAASLLGRNYRLDGEVVDGDKRGRTIGIPTANLSIWAERAIPAAGVYACQVTVGSKIWNAVTNVGIRPTFESKPVMPRIEAHLLDYQGNLYGQQVRIEFIERLRDEMKFPDVQALVAQIQTDIQKARKIFHQAG
jgi:riboflavin kinase / FMN adenylyltransferase